MLRIAERLLADKQEVTVEPLSDKFIEEIGKSPELLDYYRNQHQELNDFLVNCLSDPEVPLVLADNVTKYMYGIGNLWEQGTIPTCIPPFPTLFVETTKPQSVTAFDGPWGALFIRKEKAEVPTFVSSIMPMEAVKWVVQMILLYVDDEGGTLTAYPWTFSFLFDSDGNISWDSNGKMDFISNPTIQPPTGFQPAENDPYWEKRKHYALLMAIPFFFTFGFMHCKNVKVEPQKLTRQERRQVERKEKEGKPFLKYHILNIEPMKRILETEGRQGEVGLKKALNLCRGHFKTYTEDNPLFGKYTGTWFWDAHVRGSKDVGEVVKDYNVKLPPEDE